MTLALPWLRSGLDVLFPPVCAICRHLYQPIEGLAGICRQCLSLLNLRIGKQQVLPWPTDLLSGIPADSVILCSGYYQGTLRQALIRLKFSDAPEIAIALGSLLTRMLRCSNQIFTAVAAVPLHHNRLRERGYNQAGLLACKISDDMNIPDISDYLQRNRETLRQSAQQGRTERLANLFGAFSLAREAQNNNFERTWPEQKNKRSGQDKVSHLLLVDDIFTTGATLTAAAYPFWQIGWHVTGLVVASNRPGRT